MAERQNHPDLHKVHSLLGGALPTPHPTERRITTSFTIYNGLGVEVFWKNALGITGVEPPSVTRRTDCFCVTVEVAYGSGSEIDAVELLNRYTTDPKSAEAKIIHDQIQANRRKPFGLEMRYVTVNMMITKDMIDQAGGVLYVYDWDLIVGYRDRMAEAHPYTEAGVVKALSRESVKEPASTRQVLYVSSDDDQSLWINDGITTQEIIPVKDPRKPDGVYYTTTRRGKGETQRYDVEEALERRWVWRTRSQAEEFGDPAVSAKRMLKEKDIELARYKTELKKVQETLKEYGREKSEQTRKIAELVESLRLERLYNTEKEREERRERLEREKMERTERVETKKTWVEMLKAYGAIIAAVGAVAGIVYKGLVFLGSLTEKTQTT